MLRKNGKHRLAPRKKYISVIITELKNTWPEIIENQRLDQERKKNNRH